MDVVLTTRVPPEHRSASAVTSATNVGAPIDTYLEETTLKLQIFSPQNLQIEFILTKTGPKRKIVGYMVYSRHRRAKNIGPRVIFAPASSFSKAAISVVISIPEPRHLKKRNLRDLERDVIIFHWLNWFP